MRTDECTVSIMYATVQLYEVNPLTYTLYFVIAYPRLLNVYMYVLTTIELIQSCTMLLRW
jgi:hypothetical protein